MNDEPPSTTGATAAPTLPEVTYVPSPHAEALWDRDLGPDRGGWQPASPDELWRQVLPWKAELSVVELDGEVVSVVELTNGSEPSWDRRTVAFWANALGPGWRVHLRHPGRIDLIGPDVRPEAR